MSVESKTGAAEPRETTKRRLRAPARRALIAESAVALFAARGYGGTSMGDIAAKAGVTRAVLYDHFASKRALFISVLEEQNAVFLGHVGARITGEGDARERMRSTMATVFDFARRYPDAWGLLFGNAAHGDPAIDEAARHIARSRSGAVAALLASDAEAAGIDWDGRQAEVIVAMLIAALRGAVAWWRENPDAPVDELIDAGDELLWVGLGRG
jgi:AcrR family transcriptional regulator